MDLYEISTDKNRLDIHIIHDFLKNHSYWAQNRSLDTIYKSIENSHCFGMYLKDNPEKQIGFGRAVTDFATFYYLADVFIIPEYQNKGIGKILMQCIVNYPKLKGLRGILTTQTAHKFYAEIGFTQENILIKERMMVYAPRL